MIVYVETSAVAKLLFEEAESSGLKEFLDQVAADDSTPLASILLETGLRRAAVREKADQQQVTAVLERFDLIEPDRSIYVEAGLIPGENLRSLDAIHVATALRAQADVFLTYDDRQAEAAAAAGLLIESPGR